MTKYKVVIVYKVGEELEKTEVECDGLHAYTSDGVRTFAFSNGTRAGRKIQTFVCADFVSSEIIEV